VTRPPDPLRHEPLLGEEKILMIDYAPVQARGKREAFSSSLEGGQAMAITAKALNAPPPPTTDGMDKLYH
jgi:hypothetical protein